MMVTGVVIVSFTFADAAKPNCEKEWAGKKKIWFAKEDSVSEIYRIVTTVTQGNVGW